MNVSKRTTVRLEQDGTEKLDAEFLDRAARYIKKEGLDGLDIKPIIRNGGSDWILSGFELVKAEGGGFEGAYAEGPTDAELAAERERWANREG